jgi:hypothetical protein
MVGLFALDERVFEEIGCGHRDVAILTLRHGMLHSHFDRQAHLRAQALRRPAAVATGDLLALLRMHRTHLE